MSGDVLVGRAAEEARIATLVRQAEGGSGGALLVVGPPGIGKTSLLTEVRRTHQHVRCLTLTGLEVEQPLGYAALATLLAQTEDLLPDHLDAVLRGATGVGERRPVGLEAHQALLELVGVLGNAEPTLLVVDDAQWIDTATLGLLGFVARRLGNDRVAMVVASRPDDDVAAALSGLEEMSLTPMTRADGRELLAPRRVSPEVADACWASAQGNPLAMTELADAFTDDQRAGQAPLPHPLPAAESVRRETAARLVGLTGASRTALAVVAVEGTGAPAVLTRALATIGVPIAALDQAVSSGLLQHGSHGWEWRHPLARSAVLAELSDSDVRAAHRTVAAALDPRDTGLIALHLAAATVGCDDDLADRLEALARDSADRGASEAAAQAWAASARLTVSEEQRIERMLASVTAQWRLGDSAGTVAAAQALLREVRDPVQRARCALLAGQASTWWEGPLTGARLLRQEAERVAGDSPASAALLSAFASNGAMLALDPLGVVADAERTRAWAGEGSEAGLAILADAMESLGRLMGGDAVRGRELLAPLPELSRLAIEHRVPGGDAMAQVVATALVMVEDWPAAQELLDDLQGWCRATGHTGMESYAGDQLADLDWRRGRWESIGGRVSRLLTLSEAVEQPVVHQFRLRLARLDAARGRFESADATAERALETGLAQGFLNMVVWAREVLALSARGRGDVAAALRQLDALEVLHQDQGLHGPGMVWWQAAHVELLAEAGRRTEAERAAARLAHDHALVPGRWGAAAVARAEAALAADPDVAATRLRAAADELQALGAPFEVALTRLQRGRALRRAGRYADARPDLVAALGRFDQLGAAPWSEQALALLDRPADVPRHQPLTGRLSDAELRVARAIGGGMTNRQAAAELFLSAHTVNSHLRAIYQRLGINSRTQLAALLAREGD